MADQFDHGYPWKDHGILVRHGDFSDVARAMSLLNIPFSWGILERILFELDFCRLGRSMAAVLAVLYVWGRVDDSVVSDLSGKIPTLINPKRFRRVRREYLVCVHARSALERVLLCPYCLSPRVAVHSYGWRRTPKRYICRGCRRTFRPRPIHLSRRARNRAVRAYLLRREGLKIREIASRLGISTKTVVRYLRYVHRALIEFKRIQNDSRRDPL